MFLTLFLSVVIFFFVNFSLIGFYYCVIFSTRKKYYLLDVATPEVAQMCSPVADLCAIVLYHSVTLIHFNHLRINIRTFSIGCKSGYVSGCRRGSTCDNC
jgi:hypothetical protein